MIFRLLLFNQIFFLHCKALSTRKYRRYINTFIIIIIVIIIIIIKPSQIIIRRGIQVSLD